MHVSQWLIQLLKLGNERVTAASYKAEACELGTKRWQPLVQTVQGKVSQMIHCRSDTGLSDYPAATTWSS